MRTMHSESVMKLPRTHFYPPGFIRIFGPKLFPGVKTQIVFYDVRLLEYSMGIRVIRAPKSG